MRGEGKEKRRGEVEAKGKIAYERNIENNNVQQLFSTLHGRIFKR